METGDFRFAYLIEQLPPLVLIGLLDRNPGWRVPHALAGRQVGVHVLLGSGLDDLDPLRDGGLGRPRAPRSRRPRQRMAHLLVGADVAATHDAPGAEAAFEEKSRSRMSRDFGHSHGH